MEAKVSIEALGDMTEEVIGFLMEFVGHIEGAVPYVRQPETFLGEFLSDPRFESPENPPHFSIYASAENRQEVLVLSLIALRVNQNDPNITRCVVYDAQAIPVAELRAMCKHFVRCLADRQGGIRWLYKLDEALRDATDP